VIELGIGDRVRDRVRDGVRDGVGVDIITNPDRNPNL
jgi:hypothetical protein